MQKTARRNSSSVELANALRPTITRLARRLRQQDHSGLGPTTTAALGSIKKHGGPTHGELASIEQVAPPTITAVVGKLESLGLVTREIGVRVTLGAGTRQVLGLIVGQGLRLTMTGVVIGLVLAAFGTPLTRSLLFNISPFDPFSFIAVSLLLVAVALMASYIPARRAMKVDPVVALRQE